MGDTNTETEEIKRIIKSYFQLLYSTEVENLEEMANFLDRYQIPKLNQDQIDHLKCPITPKDIEWVIESLPMENNNNSNTGPDGFSAEFY